MKRMICLFVALLLVIPCSGIADNLSIGDLYQTTPESWVTIASVDGKQQEITVPVYIPEVTDVPLLRVKHKQLRMMSWRCLAALFRRVITIIS